ncbi:TniQ family protein [Paraburkholderia dilworthii]|uniref:TniQ family protein n=1 Tax=Paraburkholderia dilworthii TaxID=948106 RepID=UPI00041E05CA|nr:TniQ family protein [Paraburkholderia dilworthii]
MDAKFVTLEPVEGSAGQESATSIVYRLAEENCLIVNDFLKALLSLDDAEAHVLAVRLRGKDACVLDGASPTSKRVVAAMEHQLGIRNIERLTCHPLKGRVSNSMMLRRQAAWCPICLEEWRREDGGHVHQPLLWRFQHIVDCVVHNIPMETICPFCGEPPRTYSGLGRVGCCGQCGKWLGSKTRRRSKTFVPENQDGFQILELLRDTTVPELATVSFGQTLLKIVADGLVGRAELRDALGCEIKVYERSVPTVETLLRVSSLSGISMQGLVVGDVTKVVTRCPCASREAIALRARYSGADMRERVWSIARRREDLSPSAICRMAGYPLHAFRRRYPHEVREIYARYIDYQRSVKETEAFLIERKIDELISRGCYVSWRKITTELPGIFVDEECAALINRTLEARGLVRNERGYLVAKR